MALQWTNTMSTSEYRSIDAESDLPISATELAALASQIVAASRPGPDSPPEAAPVAPGGATPGGRPGAPAIRDLGWSDAPTAAPAVDEANYYFLTGAAPSEPVPQLPDEHEVFDVNSVRADFPILQETVNGKPLI